MLQINSMIDHIMHFAAFHKACEKQQVIADHLDDVAQSLSREMNRSGGLELLFGLASYALYRHLKNVLDRQRGRQQAELRQTMEDEILKLVSVGWPKNEALNAVIVINQKIEQLPDDSAVVVKGLSLLS